METYYVLVKEWLYPTESGSDALRETFDSYAEALENADLLCEQEMDNFRKACGCDPDVPDHMLSVDGLDKDPVGSVLTDGLSEWWFGVRIVKLERGMENWR